MFMGYGECVEIFPVDAVKMENDILGLDLDWCIGFRQITSRMFYTYNVIKLP